MDGRMTWSRWLTAMLVLLVLLGGLGWKYQLFGLAHHWLKMKQGEGRWADSSIWLPAYRVSIEAREVQGIADDASGLTFDPVRGTLFTVINSPPAVAELSREGRLLRHIRLRGMEDAEGITHVRDDLFVLADERLQQLLLVRIGDDTKEIDTRDAPRLGLAIELSGNLGFEGVSWDSARERLLVAKEKSPLRIYEISGLPGVLRGERFDLQISEWKESRSPGLFMRDLSSLTLHEPTGHMLLLSDDSKLVVEYDTEGNPLSLMPLWRGWHGLARSVPQPEGVAVDDEGALYLLSEPNLFYRFERAARPPWLPPQPAP